MKQLLITIGDRLQAIFPPNRIMLLLAGPITAASIWLSAVITANVPGITLPIGVIAGAIGAAALITVTLIYKWFDQWQKGEPVDYDEDLANALEELANAPDVHSFFEAHGTLQAFGEALAHLRGEIEAGKVNEAEVHTAITALEGVAEKFLNEHPVDVDGGVAHEVVPEPAHAPVVDVAAEGPADFPEPPTDRVGGR